ncbi:hypothetical protein ACS0TY_030513 [Phlomoides rotata]
MYGFSRREEPRWSSPDCPDPTSESKVGSTLDLTRIAPSILLRRGSGTDEHIELSMWLRALTAQAQRRNYQGRALQLS